MPARWWRSPLVYFVLAKLGLQTRLHQSERQPDLAADRLCPRRGAAVRLPRIWPAIFVGAFAANATTAGTLETSAVIALGNTLEGLVGGALINHWSGGRRDLRYSRRAWPSSR